MYTLKGRTAVIAGATGHVGAGAVHMLTEAGMNVVMVTHNMADALSMGNRLIMMWEGRIIYDVKGPEKDALTVEDLLKKFEEESGSALDNDRMLLG